MGPIFNGQAGFPLKMGLIGRPEMPGIKLPIYTNTKSQKSKDFIYSVVEAWNHNMVFVLYYDYCLPLAVG